jgi:hypothetical protein
MFIDILMGEYVS